jgi:hypothetical protein
LVTGVASTEQLSNHLVIAHQSVGQHYQYSEPLTRELGGVAFATSQLNKAITLGFITASPD